MKLSQIVTHFEEVANLAPEFDKSSCRFVARQGFSVREVLRLRAWNSTFPWAGLRNLIPFARFKKLDELSIYQKGVLLESGCLNRSAKYVRYQDVSIPADNLGRHKELENAIKGWEVCNWVPSRLARAIGKMSRANQVLAYCVAYKGYIKRFWEKFDVVRKMTILELVDWFDEENHDRSSWQQGQKLICEYIELKLGIKVTPEDLPHLIRKYPREVMAHEFGCKGKKTFRLLCEACEGLRDAQLRWAGALFRGQEDWVQKVLQLETVIPYEPEVVPLMLTWSESVRFRMLTTTTFKYRGQEYLVTRERIRECGYLWSRIKVRPGLGRVRCWFSVHQLLSKAYVRELPDREVPVHPDWEPLDGLCSIDGRWEIEFPRSVAQLKWYGDVLHNCLGGYGDRITHGECVVFVVKERGVPTYCVKVADMNITEFLGDHNGEPTREIEKDISEVLRLARLID